MDLELETAVNLAGPDLAQLGGSIDEDLSLPDEVAWPRCRYL
jgi:hypothetical protein